MRLLSALGLLWVMWLLRHPQQKGPRQQDAHMRTLHAAVVMQTVQLPRHLRQKGLMEQGARTRPLHAVGRVQVAPRPHAQALARHELRGNLGSIGRNKELRLVLVPTLNQTLLIEGRRVLPNLNLTLVIEGGRMLPNLTLSLLIETRRMRGRWRRRMCTRCTTALRRTSAQHALPYGPRCVVAKKNIHRARTD